MLLQPTSPLRVVEDIEEPLRLARRKRADSVVSVCPVKQHPYWMKRLAEYGRLTAFLPADDSTQRQDLPAAFALNGVVYLARRTVLLEARTWYTPRTYAYVMPPERSLDIDSAWDLHLAELVLRAANRAR
jgi:N-acylneuraminate cytidylyltransferase/CMP-N,N'-diacetyllegionaminic acid synthase